MCRQLIPIKFTDPEHVFIFSEKIYQFKNDWPVKSFDYHDILCLHGKQHLYSGYWYLYIYFVKNNHLGYVRLQAQKKTLDRIARMLQSTLSNLQ